MAPFVISQDTALSPEQAWGKVVDWPAHGRHVPFTTVSVWPDGPAWGEGATVIAHTGVGPVGFDDIMQVVTWSPPMPGPDAATGFCRLEKTGKVIKGWAEIRVDPHDDGARVVWTEEATPVHLPRFAEGVAALSGKILFGRVLRQLLKG